MIKWFLKKRMKEDKVYQIIQFLATWLLLRLKSTVLVEFVPDVFSLPNANASSNENVTGYLYIHIDYKSDNPQQLS